MTDSGGWCRHATRCAGCDEGERLLARTSLHWLRAQPASPAIGARDAAGHRLARPAFDATRSKGRSYNRRHLPLASRLPG
ncbi:hypothetical protein CFB49_26960 [Burkholderia sp. AU17457]|nr:hypothetical protein CFB49_26960 [Burkholderia sp. AU17457]